MASIELIVNGRARNVETAPETPLLYVLRNQLGLTGAKFGCGLEQCGACAVLVDGKRALACTMPVSDLAGASVATVEGLSVDGALSPVQTAFVAETAAQCGYCTPGLLIAVTALFERSPRPSDAEVAEALSGHLCRCGSQPRVLAAIRRLREGTADDRT